MKRTLQDIEGHDEGDEVMGGETKESRVVIQEGRNYGTWQIDNNSFDSHQMRPNGHGADKVCR